MFVLNLFDDYTEMFNDIEKYIASLNPENLICKKMITDKEFDIMGEIDLLDLNGGKIIDFKCSRVNTFKLEWMLQLLGYYSIIKKNYPLINNNKSDKIKILEIYNPLQGEIYSLDISLWDKENEYLSYLYDVRLRQLNRNTCEEIECLYPIKFDKIVNKNNKIGKFIKNILKHHLGKIIIVILIMIKKIKFIIWLNYLGKII